MKGNILKLPVVAIASVILSFSALAENITLSSSSNGVVTVGEQVTTKAIQRSASSPLSGVFIFSYPSWVNISGSCQKLIYLVTSNNGYSQLYHTSVEAWGIASSTTPYTDSTTAVTHAAIASVSCNSYAPGIEF